MEKMISMFLTLALLNHIVVNQFRGLSSLLVFSKNKKTIFQVSILVAIILILSSIITYTLYQYLLRPLEVEYLDLVVFTLVIIVITILVQNYIKTKNTSSYEHIGDQLTLMMLDSVILFITLDNVAMNYSLVEVCISAVAVATGFILFLICFSHICDRLDHTAIPSAMKGVPISFVVAALIAIALNGLAGIA